MANLEPSKLLTLQEAATFLEISPATLRNWQKAGIANSSIIKKKHFFCEVHIASIQSKIKSGEITRLNRRANKTQKSSTRKHLELGDRKLHAANSQVLDLLHSAVGTKEELLCTISMAVALNRGKEYLIPSIESIFNCKAKNNLVNPIQEILKPFAKSPDVLGLAYQTMLSDGTKSKKGAIYTPFKIAKDTCKKLIDRPKFVLDPCCGSGIYLYAAALQLKEMGIKEWSRYLTGIDIDTLATKVCKVSLALLLEEGEKAHFRILNRDFFSMDPSCKDIVSNKVDVVLSNPPWGKFHDKKSIAVLKKNFPEITSRESFSYFISHGLNFLRQGGRLSYLLPESIFFTNYHKDIRKLILDITHCDEIKRYGRAFSGLLTNVNRLDLIKGNEQREGSRVKISDQKTLHYSDLDYFRQSMDFYFSIDLDEVTIVQFKRVESNKVFYLGKDCNWGLGIVTGDNKKFLFSETGDGLLPVLKGSDIKPYVAHTPTNFINYDRDRLQQVAPDSIFKTSPKLVYKFINRKLVFAIDFGKNLTLNSANILIPDDQKPIYYYLALFNSRYANWYFQKKFNSIKVLRSHLENIPLPLLEKVDEDKMIQAVKDVLNGIEMDENKSKIDRIIEGFFGINLC